MVDVQLDFDAGSRRDPAPQAGLASATALMACKGRGCAGWPAGAGRTSWRGLGRPGRSFGGSAGADHMSFALRTP